MKLNDLIVPLTLAFLVSLGIQYYIVNRSDSNASTEIVSGQSFTAAPREALTAKPLNKEIDFLDQKTPLVPSQDRVETDNAIYTFSTVAGSLEQFTFKRRYHGGADLINTLVAQDNRNELRAFLLAFDSNTPLEYVLKNKVENQDTTSLVYEADFEGGSVTKTFIVYHNSFRIDLRVTVNPRAGAVVTPRLFFPSPEVKGLKDDAVFAIMNNEKNSLVTEAGNKLADQQGWFAPTLFGTQDRYFVHAMISNPDNFVKRAYYKFNGLQQLVTILEGPSIEKETSWSLSFYMGPKEGSALSAVDSRLEKTLGFSGVLAPLSKVLLAILNFFYKYLKNYGLAIIALTLSLNLIVLPLRRRGNEQMKKTAELQKKLAYVQQRYKNDPEAMAREKAELIRKYGTGLGGCLPNLILLPVFFALSPVLSHAIELYKAPFTWWIHDLSAKDPYYILPIIIIIAFCLRALLAEPNQRLSMLAVALIFGAISTNLSAGLSLYILVGVLMDLRTNIPKKKVKVA